jgi:hypothetical protein
MKKQIRTNFEAVTIGAIFHANGCAFEKKSSRTAWLLQHNAEGFQRQSLWFYFGKAEAVVV